MSIEDILPIAQAAPLFGRAEPFVHWSKLKINFTELTS